MAYPDLDLAHDFRPAIQREHSFNRIPVDSLFTPFTGYIGRSILAVCTFQRQSNLSFTPLLRN
jgi:hypothetical protein